MNGHIHTTEVKGGFVAKVKVEGGGPDPIEFTTPVKPTAKAAFKSALQHLKHIYL